MNDTVRPSNEVQEASVSSDPIAAYDKLRQIREDMENDDILCKHIGLRNLHSRIQLIFGKKYGCDIKSENGFTTVKITIPNI